MVTENCPCESRPLIVRTLAHGLMPAWIYHVSIIINLWNYTTPNRKYSYKYNCNLLSHGRDVNSCTRAGIQKSPSQKQYGNRDMARFGNSNATGKQYQK